MEKTQAGHRLKLSQVELTTSTPVKFISARLGEIEYLPHQVIEMARGILGFEKLKRYIIIERKTDFPFKWLQSLDDPALAFVLMDPMLFKPDYRVQISSAEAEAIKAADVNKCVVMVIISIPQQDASKMTANLLGPIIFNTDTKLAIQVVLSDQEYTTRHKIIP